MQRNNNIKRKLRRKGKAMPNYRTEMVKQITQVDFYVVDWFETFTFSNNNLNTLYSGIITSTDYTNLQISFGEFKILYIEIAYTPIMTTPLVATDNANAIFAFRQGVFEAAPAAKSAINAARLPGSKDVCKFIPFRSRFKIYDPKFFASTTTDTIVSEYPKVTYYLSPYLADTTNNTFGLFHMRVGMNVRNKIE